MATHYKGQRISDLLAEIEQIKRTLDDNDVAHTRSEKEVMADGYAKLALMKAKLTALQGEDDDQKSI